MKTRALFLLFILFSTSFVLLTLYICAEPIHLNRLETERIARIQKVCEKESPRKRDRKIPQRSFSESQQVIANILKVKPLEFVDGKLSLESSNTIGVNPNRVTLKKIIEVLNHTDGDIVVSIATHTNKNGSKKRSLQRSQESADQLKAYIRERANILLVVAIGYGEEMPLSPSKKGSNNRRVEIEIKRIDS